MAQNGVLKYARVVAKQARGRPGWLENILWHIVSYFVTNITMVFLWFFFFVLNRVTVIGREHVGGEPNTLLLSNHQSMIDSIPLGIAGFYPKSWIKPWLVPWHPAARENFFKNRLIAWYATHTRCIPVKPGRRDVHAIHKMIDVLPNGSIILFPEGTRSRTGDVQAGRPGAGLVALATRPRIIPVAIDGMREVMPIGKKMLRPFKRITISYGEPFDYSAYRGRPRSKETAQELVDEIMEVIRRQLDEIRTSGD